MQLSAVDRPVLLLRAVLRGAVTIVWRNREVRLDEDSYLVLAAGAASSSRSCGDEPAQLLTLALGGAAIGNLAPAENLRPMDGAVGRRLRSFKAMATPGQPLAVGIEQLHGLAADVLDEETALRQRSAGIGAAKPATREALFRRILLAADFILSHHDEALSLDDMASAASLSRFHFVRLFRLVHGETPHAFLLRKRTAVARRHLAVGGDAREAAARAGFGSRTTLFRNLRKPAPGVNASLDDGAAACSRSA